MIQTQRYAGLVFLLSLTAIWIIYAWRGVKLGKVPQVRDFAALNAIPEGIDKAVEEGKKVLIVDGSAGFTGSTASYTLAYLEAVKFSVELCAQKDADFVCAMEGGQAMPIVQSIVEEQLSIAGQPERYNDSLVRYMPRNIPILAMIENEGVSCAINIGHMGGGKDITLGATREAGAINICGSPRWWGMQIASIYADYLLIGDETFAASDKLSGDPLRISSLRAGDMCRFMVMILLFLAIIFTPLIDALML